jgi:hypothetical protein
VINLKDAIITLQVLSIIIPESQVYQQADVDTDSQIGLEEVLYILEMISQSEHPELPPGKNAKISRCNGFDSIEGLVYEDIRTNNNLCSNTNECGNLSINNLKKTCF